MPFDTSPDLPATAPPTDRASRWLAIIAVAFVAACLLIISPDQRGERDRPWPAHGTASWLLDVVRLQALNYAFPTQQGVEIKEIIFQFGACLLSLAGAIILWHKRHSFRPTNILRSPATWFAIAVLISAIAAWRSAAPRAAAGGTIIRLFWLLWWWPLAYLLTPRAARGLFAGLITASALTAAIGLWYQHDRALPGLPLGYPLGSSLFLGACLLPALMAACVLAATHLGRLLPARRAATAKASEPPIDFQSRDREGAGSVPDEGSSGSRTDIVNEQSPLPHGRGSESEIRAPLAQPAVAESVSSRRSALRQGLIFALLALLLLGASILTSSRSARMGFSAGLLVAVYIASDRLVRAWLLATLAVSCGLLAGGLLVSGNVSGAVTSTIDQFTGRSASIRARIDHEWPFAAAIFMKHPWLGSGEGGFGRMVGPYVRTGQIDDPTLLNPDASIWESHAHNELLEMLDSIGLLGTAAMLAAVYFTLRAVRRAIQAAPHWRARAWLIGATAAFVAVCTEELTDIALHKAGFAPLALTTWACLWAMIKSTAARKIPALPQITRPHPAMAVAAAMLIALTATGGMVAASANATAYRDFYEGNRRLAEGHPATAIAPFDQAANRFLDPARYLNAVILSAHARVYAAQSLMNQPNTAQRTSAEQLAREAIQRTDYLIRIAERYLRVRELEAAAATLLAQVAEQHNDRTTTRRWAERARRAWRLNRDDEPFQMQALIWLWEADPAATPQERLGWLREMMRGGEVESRWDILLQQIGPAIAAPLQHMLDAANNQTADDPAKWHDPLLPETFRLAARAAWLGGNRSAASQLAETAGTLCARAGPRLARAHGAALHEQATYLFDEQPARVADALELLKRAYERVNGIRTDGPMAGNMGRTRLIFLLFMKSDADARAQAAILTSQPRRSVEQVMADAYMRLVVRFTDRAGGDAVRQIEDWCQRATALDPNNADAWGFLAATALRLDQVDVAAHAIREYRRTEPRRQAAENAIQRLQSQFPRSPVWQSPAASAPASKPSSGSGSN